MLKVTLMSLKPLRTSLSAPRIPRMSWLPSTVASTERSWMPRFCATDATPAVRQLASPTSRYSIGVIPLSVGGEDVRVIGVEHGLGLVALLLAEAEEVLDRRLCCGRRSATSTTPAR